MPSPSDDPVTGLNDPPPPQRPESPIHPISLLAGAGAAAAAAIIGGQLGLSGTVAGAAVGSVVAALAATTIKHSVHRSRAAVAGLRHRGSPRALAPAYPAWRTWLRRGVVVAAPFALGIMGLMAVQLGVGRALSPGTGQLQHAAARVVAPTHAPTRTVVVAPPAPTATVTVTATPSPSPSASASASADPVKGPSAPATPSSSPSAATVTPPSPAA